MLEPGTILANYKIIELLASGGMGQVYVAEDQRLERRIALKVLPADMSADAERLERFEREAKVVASLNHPNIVTIHSVEDTAGPDDTVHFITMELVEGQTLDKLIPQGGLPIDRFFAAAVPLADAVGGAHQNGITHRDLKPGNVMITDDGRVKVLDFGLAKLADAFPPDSGTDEAAATAATAAAPITEEGKVLGTVAYMSPEQAEGKAVDNRSDIFSLGILLYEMTTGTRPFSGDTKISLMSSIIKDTPVSVTEVNTELPNHLGRIIKHCLEKDPDRRFQSAQDVRNELVGLKEEIDSDLSVVSEPTAPVPGSDPSVVSGPHAGAPATDPSLIASGVGGGGGLLHNKLALGGIVAAAIVVGALGWSFLGGGGDSGRSASPGSSVPAAGGLEPLADTRPSVAVLYFDNLTGDDTLDWLRSGITELLVTDLSQTPEIRVLTTDFLYEILEDLGELDARVTSAAVVREVAERAGVEHVVVGSFIRAGDTFRLSARLQKPSTGETLTAETVEGAGEDSVFASVDDLTQRIKNRLDVPVTTSTVIDRDLADVTTGSTDAYRHYIDGVMMITQSRWADAIPLFERAIEVDPEFAMAFAKLSIVYGNILDIDNGKLYAEKAIEHADRLTPRERYYIEGRYYSLEDETSLQSVEAYENALALYPDDSASRNNVAIEYRGLERYEEALAHFEELLRRGTTFLQAYANTAFAYANNGECDQGIQLIEDFLRNEPDYHFGFRSLGDLAVRCNELETADNALDVYEESIAAGAPMNAFDGILRWRLLILDDEFDAAAEALTPLAESVSPVARHIAYPGNIALTRTYQGRGQETLENLRENAVAIEAESGDLYGAWMLLGYNQLELGDLEAALETVDRARGYARQASEEAEVAAFVASAQARAGRLVAARTAAQQHDRINGRLPHRWARRSELVLDAELAVAQGNLDDSVDYLREAYDLLPPGPNNPPFDEYVRVMYPLALALMQRGDASEAMQLFEAITALGSQRINYPFEYVRSFYHLGQIAAEDGDNAAARRYYQRFLDYWGDGDIDTDRVAEARAFVEGA